VGVPARVVPSSHPDVDYIAAGAASYARMAATYVAEGIGASGGGEIQDRSVA
jgi:hypothetical protein